MMICVILFLVYIGSRFMQLMNKKDISSYQVRSGSLATDSTFRALVEREEEVFYAERTGYIQYFAREGEHLGAGDLLYAIDETGSINELMNRQDGESQLNEQQLDAMHSDMVDFTAVFSAADFAECYDFLYSVEGNLLKLANANVFASLEEINSSYNVSLAGLHRATKPGYVVYHVDGLESVSTNNLTAAFDEEAHPKQPFYGGDLVDTGEPVYKMITSEEWYILLPMNEERALELQSEGYVRIRFLKNFQTYWGEVIGIDSVEEDVWYVRLKFNTGMVNFCTDRYVDVELVEKNGTGLKIPLSAIVHKEFFLVPKDYLYMEGEENKMIFLRKTFMEDATVSNTEIAIEVYAEDDDYYYVDDTQLRIGDYLIKPDSLAEYPVSLKGELTGVYNINKGYADFRRIVILYQNEEFAIVKSNTAYGLSEYDYIALNAWELTDDELVYE